MAERKINEILEDAKNAEKRGLVVEACNKYLLITHSLIQKKQFDLAQETLERAYRLAPHSSRIIVKKVIIHEEKKEHLQAQKDLKNCISLLLHKKNNNPHAIQTVLNEFVPYPRLKKLFFEYYLELDKTNPKVLIMYLNHLLDEKEYSTSLSVLITCIEIVQFYNKENIMLLTNAIKKFFVDMKSERLLTYWGKVVLGEMTKSEFTSIIRAHIKPHNQMQESHRISEKKNFTSTSSPVPSSSLSDLIHDLEKELGFLKFDMMDETSPILSEFKKKTNELLKNNPKGHLDLALAYYEMELFKESHSELEAIKPDDDLYSYGLYLRGLIYKNQNNLLQATESFQTILSQGLLEKNLEQESRYQLILLYIKLKDYPLATDQIEWFNQNKINYRNIKELAAKIKEYSTHS